MQSIKTSEDPGHLSFECPVKRGKRTQAMLPLTLSLDWTLNLPKGASTKCESGPTRVTQEKIRWTVMYCAVDPRRPESASRKEPRAVMIDDLSTKLSTIRTDCGRNSTRARCRCCSQAAVSSLRSADRAAEAQASATPLYSLPQTGRTQPCSITTIVVDSSITTCALYNMNGDDGSCDVTTANVQYGMDDGPIGFRVCRAIRPATLNV